MGMSTFNDDDMAVLTLKECPVQAPFIMLRKPSVPRLLIKHGSE